jgi:hypothetical protein
VADLIPHTLTVMREVGDLLHTFTHVADEQAETGGDEEDLLFAGRCREIEGLFLAWANQDIPHEIDTSEDAVSVMMQLVEAIFQAALSAQMALVHIADDNEERREDKDSPISREMYQSQEQVDAYLLSMASIMEHSASQVIKFLENSRISPAELIERSNTASYVLGLMVGRLTHEDGIKVQSMMPLSRAVDLTLGGDKIVRMTLDPQ